MEKGYACNLRGKVKEVIWEIADHFSDYENSKSIPYTLYEVKIPIEIINRKNSEKGEL